MFKNAYQNGLLSIFYSCGSNPLAIWDTEVQNGHIKRITDSDVNSIVLEIASTNVATTYMSCPKRNQVLGIKLPFLVMIIKNLKRYFSFEITILDDKNMRRRFRISNFQSTTKIKPFCTSMPIGLSGGWNQIQFNLADFTQRAYGTHFIEALRVQVHANARLRRIYFCDRLYTEEELPQDYKLYLPFENKQKRVKTKKETPIKKEDKIKKEVTPKISKENNIRTSVTSVGKLTATEPEVVKEKQSLVSEIDAEQEKLEEVVKPEEIINPEEILESKEYEEPEEIVTPEEFVEPEEIVESEEIAANEDVESETNEEVETLN